VSAPSGNFIFQNYRQALERIETNGERLALLASKLGTTPDDYEAYLNSEREYLAGLRVEPAEDVLKADYIELLNKLYRLQCVVFLCFLATYCFFTSV
jgi:hypothetical protein